MGRDGLVELLHNREVVSFVQQAMAAYGDDAPRPPEPLDDELARELVSFARRVAGRPTLAQLDGRPEEAGPAGYWYVSPETDARLRALEEKARALGDAHTVAQLLALDEVRARVADDLGVAASRDGLATDRESLRSVVVGNRAPADGAERFLRAAFEELRGLLDAHARLPFTAASLFCLHGRLSRLAEECGAAPGPVPARWPAESPFTFSPTPLGPGSLAAPVGAFETMGADPLCALYMVSDSIWECRPFPSWNGLMEVLARAMAFSARGLPVLALVPFSRLRLDWECGLSGCPQQFSYGNALVMDAHGVDSTPCLLQVIAMFEEGMRRLEASVAAHDRSTAARLDAVEADQRLNLRQRQFLREVLSTGETAADVHGYGKCFDVALTTARSDLNQLVALGWLRAEYEGKRQVFVLA